MEVALRPEKRDAAVTEVDSAAPVGREFQKGTQIPYEKRQRTGMTHEFNHQPDLIFDSFIGTKKKRKKKTTTP